MAFCYHITRNVSISRPFWLISLKQHRVGIFGLLSACHAHAHTPHTCRDSMQQCVFEVAMKTHLRACFCLPHYHQRQQALQHTHTYTHTDTHRRASLTVSIAIMATWSCNAPLRCRCLSRENLASPKLSTTVKLSKGGHPGALTHSVCFQFPGTVLR